MVSRPLQKERVYMNCLTAGADSSLFFYSGSSNMPRTPRPSAAKHWVFTLNNPTVTPEELLEHMPSWDAEYAVFQLEMGEEGTPHLQGYVEFKNRRRLAAIKKLAGCSTMHLEKRLGTREEARDYSMKQDTREDGPFEFGVWQQSAQGKRNDLIDAIDLLQSSGSLSTVAEAFPSTYVRYHAGLAKLINIRTPHRDDAPTVSLLVGPTGVGKTRYVRDAEDPDDLWVAPPGSAMKWFDFHSGHPAALFDEYCGKLSKVSLDVVLQIVDRYGIRVPVKGGYVPWTPKRIYFTSNFHPITWYDYSSRQAQYAALKRRFTDVYFWPPEATSPEAGCLHLTREHPDWDRFWADIL